MVGIDVDTVDIVIVAMMVIAHSNVELFIVVIALVDPLRWSAMS